MTKKKTKKPVIDGQVPPEITILSDIPELWLLDGQADNESLSKEALGLRAKLGATLDIIRHKDTKCPLAIAIYGDWGTGKTSAMHWLDAQLNAWSKQSLEDRKAHPKVRTIWFDPWKYDSREDVWRGIIAEVILGCLQVESIEDFTDSDFKARLGKAARQFGGFLGKSFLHALANTKFKGKVPVGTEIELNGEVFQQIVNEYQNANHPEKAYLNEFETSLKDWVRSSLGQEKTGSIIDGEPEVLPERMCIFIDDLDRCLPKVTLEVLEALKLYLDIPQLIFVVGLDRQAVDAVVVEHYKQSGLTEDKASYYLNKLFQVEVTITPTDTQGTDLFTQLVNELGDYWQQIDYKDILEDAICKLSRHNPREMKRMLNSTLLSASATERSLSILEPEKANKSLHAAQGAQNFLLLRLFEASKRSDAKQLLLDIKGRVWLKEISDFVRQGGLEKVAIEKLFSGRHHPTEKSKSENDSTKARLLSLVELEAANKKDPPISNLLEKFEQLKRAAPPLYNQQNEKIPLLEIFNMRDPQHTRLLIDLLSISFNPDAAAFSLSSPPERERRKAELPPLGESQTNKSVPLNNFSPELKSRIADSLGIDSTDLGNALTVKQIEQITQLDLSSTQISDLTPISHLKQLQTLKCNRTQISDLTPISELKSLKSLACGHTKISDLTPISDLNQLKILDCSNTQVSDLKPISKLEELQALYCSRSNIRSLTPTAKLKELQLLYCWNTKVSDLKPISDLKQLSTLSCGDTQISDLTPISKLYQLQKLYCSETPISDLTPISELKNLQTLICGETKILNLNPISELNKLKELGCWDTKIRHLNPISKLKQLRALSCGDNQIRDLTPISELKQLHTLYCGDTQIRDLTPVSKLAQLHTLVCNNTLISDLAPISELKKLRTLDCSDNQIHNFMPIFELDELARLVCCDSQMSKEMIERLRKSRPDLNIIF